jgi:phosphoribosylformimino-5-aminoimidazole carboxamide ribotide isomerase
VGLTIYPAIDLKGGSVVRLRQGLMETSTRYATDPAQVARRWAEAGAEWLHVVDLDGAFAGRPQNEAAIKAIRAVVPGAKIQVGGGLRSLEAIEATFALGIDRVILGSAALSGEGAAAALLVDAVARWGAERVIVSIDAKEGWVATDGWAVTAPVRAIDLAAAVRAVGVAQILYTDITRDGMMTGPNWEGLALMGEAIRGNSPVERKGEGVIASGGIRSVADLERLQSIPGVTGAIIGRAIYEGAIDLKEALAVCR